jgi:hypothetical protein
MYSQNAWNAISETHIEGMPRACRQTPVANFCLRYSAHTFGDRILSWGEGKENGPFGSFASPTTEESLKNALLNDRV